MSMSLSRTRENYPTPDKAQYRKYYAGNDPSVPIVTVPDA
jgi:hypothetical protein